MNVLITGAAGDIGRRLVQRLLQPMDCQLNIFTSDLHPLPTELTEHDNRDRLRQHYQCDIRSDAFIDWVKSIVPDVVVHLASIVQLPANMSEADAYDIDVRATDRLLRICAAMGVRKFIVTSSGAAYGYWPDHPAWIDETTEMRGNDDYFYARHKKCVELLLSEYRQSYPQMKQVVLRPGTVLGPNFHNPITNLFEKKIVTGISGSNSPFVIIWVDDLVEYLAESVTTNVEGIFNVAGDGALTLQQISRRLNKPFKSLPAFLVKAVLTLAKPLGLTQYGPEQVKFIQYRPVLSNKKIRHHFKHQPSKTTAEAFNAFLASRDKGYVSHEK